MNKKNVTSSKNGTSTLVRARFGPGMLLEHEDLEQLNTYTRDLSRLLFRSFFGCGVVCGLVVSFNEKDNCGKPGITVSAGLALDGSGDPLHVPKAVSLPIEDDCNPIPPTELWVILCGTTKHCAPRTSMCASDEENAPAVCTREQEMFEIRVVSVPPDCACDCDPSHYPVPTGENAGYCWCAEPIPDCYRDHYDGNCGCNSGSSDCGCDCVLLAYLKQEETESGTTWKIDHRVRRFIRPVLMRDPQVTKEAEQLNFRAMQRTNMEIRMEQSLKDSEVEIQQLHGQVSDSVMQAQSLSLELENAKQLIAELQSQNADLELIRLQSAKTPETKSQREGLKKGSKKPE